MAQAIALTGGPGKEGLGLAAVGGGARVGLEQHLELAEQQLAASARVRWACEQGAHARGLGSLWTAQSGTRQALRCPLIHR